VPDHERALRAAVAKYADARAVRDEAIRLAHDEGGMSYRAIGAIVGLSYSRVAQIVRKR
jgi:transposase